MTVTDDHAFEIVFFECVLRGDEEDTTILEILANLYTKAGRIDDGLALDERLVRLDPENPTNHYNLACSLALKAREDEALDRLRRALELGFEDFSWMREDPDLAHLRRSPGFRALLAEFEIPGEGA